MRSGSDKVENRFKLLGCGVTCFNCCCMVLLEGVVHLYRHKLDKVHDTVLRNINCKGEECADV